MSGRQDESMSAVAIRQVLYGIIRYMPSRFMNSLRATFYRGIGLKIGVNVQLTPGVMVDVWRRQIPCRIGNNVYVGENSLISGGVEIGDGTSINSNVTISASRPTRIVIENDCLIGPNVVIRSDDHRYDDPYCLIKDQGRVSGDILIEQDCWLGANVVVLKGARLGAHSVVGAGTIVNKSFPPYSVIVGNPARLIKQRKKQKE